MNDDEKAKMLRDIANDHDTVCVPTCPVPIALRAGAERLAAGGGPAQVATEEYRDHWTTIFGKKVAAAEA